MPSPHWTPTPAATEVDRRETVPEGVSAASAAVTSQYGSTSTARASIVQDAWRMSESFRPRGCQQTEQSQCHRCASGQTRKRREFRVIVAARGSFVHAGVGFPHECVGLLPSHPTPGLFRPTGKGSSSAPALAAQVFPPVPVPLLLLRS